VAFATFKTLNQISTGGIPDTDASIERAGRDIASVRRDSDSSDAIFDAQNENLLTNLDVPEADGLIAASRSNMTAISGEVERVDILFVTCEDISDLLRLNVPNLDPQSANRTSCQSRLKYPNQFVFSTCSKKLAIRAETNAPNIKITVLVDTVILKN
jgi:hypothetical protein